MAGGGTAGQTLGAGASGYNPFSTSTSNVAQRATALSTPVQATNQATTNPTATSTTVATTNPTTTATPVGNARVASNQNWNLQPGQVTRNMAGRFIYLDPTTGQYMNTGNKDFALYSAGPNATMQAAPEGFNFARGDYRFGPGTVGRYDGQYVFKDPVTGRYLSTGSQADAYLRAMGTDGKALTLQPRGTFYGGTYTAGMPQSYGYSSGADLYNALNPRNAFGMSLGTTPVSRDIANQMYGYGSQLSQAQGAFGSIYDKLLENTFQGNNLNTALDYLVDYSKQAANARDQYMGLANQYAPRANSMAGAGGGVQQEFIPQQQFTLPPETWDMNHQQLMNWIQNHEAKAGSMGFLDTALSGIGKGLIGGSFATGLTGITDPFSLINSGVSQGITGRMNRKASGGIVDLVGRK